MSQYGHTAGDHDSDLISLRSPYYDLVSHYPLFDPKPGGPRLCTQSSLHEVQTVPLIHEDLSFGEFFCTTVAPSLPPEWAANLPKLFPQPYTWQGPECLDTSSLVSFSQVDSSSDPPLGNGSSAHPILRPISAGTDCQNAAASGQHSRTKHSSFIEDSFPLSSNIHCDLRRALARVMASPWKLQNLLEPRQGTLLDFLKYETDSKRWLCCFWTKGTPCSCSFSKKDQAKNHIRFHIKHLPFSCNSRGICPKDGLTCSRRFCSAEALQKHRGPQKECKNCGKLMLKSNLRRHSVTACPHRRHRDQFPSSNSLTSLV